MESILIWMCLLNILICVRSIINVLVSTMNNIKQLCIYYLVPCPGEFVCRCVAVGEVPRCSTWHNQAVILVSFCPAHVCSSTAPHPTYFNDTTSTSGGRKRETVFLFPCFVSTTSVPRKVLAALLYIRGKVLLLHYYTTT